MPPTVFDIFSQNAFSLQSLTAAVNNLPYLPTRTRDLNLFEGEGVTTTTVVIEQRSGTLSLVQSSPYGSPPAQDHEERRTVRSLSIPHLSVGDKIFAHEVQNIRSFGSESLLETVQAKVNRAFENLRRRIEATHENMRLGALRGTIVDADASTIYNLFTEFSVSQLSEVNFALGTSTTDVRGICQALRRSMAAELGALGQGGFEIHALCSPEFFDALISHDTVKEAYKNWTAAAALAEDKTYTQFRFAGITFEDYRGSDDGSTIKITANKAHFFPVVSGLYKMYFAPADYIETVNTIGFPMYAKQAVDLQFQKYVELELQSNPLPICLKPRVLILGKKS